MITALEYEPYDPKTPRLSYGQVATLVMKLPDDALVVLMRGPIEIDGMCNVCVALEDLTSPEAKLLIDWHDHLNTSKRFNSVLEAKVKNPDSFTFMDDERHLLLGSIAYARCCVIYALARVEVGDRRDRERLP